MRRSHWIAVACVSVAAVGAVALVANRATPSTTSTTANPTPTPTPAPWPTAEERFDPLSARLTVPDVAGVHRTEHTTSAEAERVMLSDLDTTGQTRLVEITLRPRGHGGPDGDATEAVQGRPAYWVDGAGAVYQYYGVRLAFAWADDAWVYVAAAASPNAPANDETLRQLARAVAEVVVIGPPVKVALPFVVAADLPGVPDTVHPNGTHRMWSYRFPPGEAFVRASLKLVDPDADPRHGSLSIAAVSDGSHSFKPGTANRTINGRPAYDSGSGSGSGTVVVFDHAGGFTIEIAGSGEADLMLLAGSVTVVEGATHETQWTVAYLHP